MRVRRGKHVRPTPGLQRFRSLAADEVARVLDGLPPALRDRVDEVPIVIEDRPAPALAAEGMGDLLGLFTGVAFPDGIAVSQQLPPEILLFVDNLRREAGGREDVFREEVRRTLLHEIGHYLGLDEDALLARDLD